MRDEWDHPAQRKISNLKSSGKFTCQKYKIHSKLVDGQYIYGKNERQFTHPLKKCTVEELSHSMDTLLRLKNNKTARDEYNMEYGVFGDS